MNRNIKKIVITLCSMGTILIVLGLSLTLKELMNAEEMLNVADDPEYRRIIFHLNGATSIDNKIVRCKIDGNNTCTVTLPNVIKDSGIVLGFSENKDNTLAEYKMGDTINLDSSRELYVISYRTNKVIIDGTDVDYVEKDEVSCNVYNEEKECKIVVPNFNKVGYENKGYSTFQESTTGFIFPGDEYTMSKDTVFYPIYSTSARKRSLNITKTFTYQNSFIEVESGCSESVYKKFLQYLDDISKHAPFLLLGNKIAFVCDKSFNSIWGGSYVGMNYGPRGLRSVDIRCSSNSLNDYYATMVHEMAHSWDFYYASKFGDNISNQSDIINLYNKYKNSHNRPFRDYSYTNIYEFIADMMRYYYFKYEVPRENFSNLNYPSDIKKTLEKYICISKNNYDESKCDV